MLDRDALALAMRTLADEGSVVAVDWHVYRSIALIHFLPPTTPDALFAAPSGPIGSRFVPPHRPIDSLYVATEAETAHREGNQPYYQAASTTGFDPGDISPAEEVVLIIARIRLGALLDVRSPAVAHRLETTPDELRSPWKTVQDAPTQRLGEAVYRDGSFEGLIYRSARNPGGSCLVLFPDRLRPGSSVEFRSKTPGVPHARLAGPPASP